MGGATEVVLAARARPFTTVADVVVAIGIAVVGIISVVRRRKPAAVNPLNGWQIWAAVALALIGWELFCLVQGPRVDHPTLSYYLDLITIHDLGRAIAFAAWLWLGGYLVAQ